MYSAIPRIESPDAQTSCPELDAALADFHDDPITEFYGADDCQDLVIRGHMRHCVACRRLTVMS